MFLGEQEWLYLLFETSWYLNMTAKQIVLQCSRSRFEFLVSRSYKGLQSTRNFRGTAPNQPAGWAGAGSPLPSRSRCPTRVASGTLPLSAKPPRPAQVKGKIKRCSWQAQPRSNCHSVPISSAHGVCGEHGHEGAGNVLQQTIAKLLRSAIKKLAWQPP